MQAVQPGVVSAAAAIIRDSTLRKTPTCHAGSARHGTGRTECTTTTPTKPYGLFGNRTMGRTLDYTWIADLCSRGPPIIQLSLQKNGYSLGSIIILRPIDILPAAIGFASRLSSPLSPARDRCPIHIDGSSHMFRIWSSFTGSSAADYPRSVPRVTSPGLQARILSQKRSVPHLTPLIA